MKWIAFGNTEIHNKFIISWQSHYVEEIDYVNVDEEIGYPF